MNWKDHINQVANTIRDAADSEIAQNAAAKARDSATKLVEKARSGALDAAKTLVDTYDDPSAIKLQFYNLRLSIVSPCNGFEIGHPSEGIIVVSDGENNGLIINASADRAYVVETIGQVVRLSESTYDLGPQDGLNVVLMET